MTLKLRYIMYILLAYSWMSGVYANNIELNIESSFLVAKNKAEASNKPYIVQFAADWCSPCKWMDETSFRDPEIMQEIEENYVFVRVDVEEFEGQTLKKYFEIHSLPTFLIFTPDHRIVFRHEGSLSRYEMLEVLRKKESAWSDEPVTWTNPDVANQPLPTELSTGNESDVVPESVDDAITPVATWRIQIGAFGNEDNAKIKMDELSAYVQAEYRIISAQAKSGSIHRLYVGNFNSKEEASAFLANLQALGIDGMIKKVSLSENL